MIKNAIKAKRFFLWDSIKNCNDEVALKNAYNLKAFSILGVIMMSFAIMFGWVMRNVFTFNAEFVMMLGYFIVMYLVMKFIPINKKYITLTFYLWLIPLMIMGIIIGTFGDPTEPSITIMVFLCVLPMFILDKPIRIVVFILIHGVIYTVCCYYAKSMELFVADMIDLVLFTVLGVGVNCLILRDRIDNVEYAVKMRMMAEIDALTNLYNRRAGEEKINSLIEQGKSGMFLLIDFDNFKDVNDNYGHVNGDIALKSVANCLRNTFRENDVVMRFGGDEFAVFAQSLKTQKEGIKCVERMMGKIHKLTVMDMPNYKFSISVGISFVDFKNNKNFAQIYSKSDKALYVAKKNGKNNYYFYSNKI